MAGTPNQNWLARLVGNEGINLYIGILGIHSLISYFSGQLVKTSGLGRCESPFPSWVFFFGGSSREPFSWV